MIPFELHETIIQRIPHFSQMAWVFNVDSEVMAELSVDYNTDSNKVDAVIQGRPQRAIVKYFLYHLRTQSSKKLSEESACTLILGALNMDDDL